MSRIIPRRAALSAPLPTISGDGGGGGASGITFEDGFSGSGTFTDGNVVTITRSSGSWGEKPGGGPPRFWMSFNDALAVDTAYSLDESSITFQSGCTYQTAVKPVNATGCAKQDVATMGSTLAALIANEPAWTFDGGTCYVYVKRYHDHPDNDGNGGILNNKTIRYWGVDGSDESGHSAYCANGTGLCLCFVEGVSPLDPELPVGDSGRFYSGSLSIGNFDNDTFVTCEHFFKESALDTFDGILTSARDGRLTHAFDNNWVTRDDVSDPLLASGYLDQISDADIEGSIYYSCLYIDNSFKRIFLSDEETFLAATGDGTRAHREIQIPITWAPGALSFLFREGSFESLSGKVLWTATDAGSVEKIAVFQ